MFRYSACYCLHLDDIATLPRHFYTFFTLCCLTFTTSLQPKIYSRDKCKIHLGRWIVSIAVITGIVLVLVLLGYLIYALINAEAF